MELAQHLGRQSLTKAKRMKDGAILATSDLLGIEVELENIHDVAHCPKSWMVHADGSLRNEGREFIFAEPLGGEAAEKAIIDFEQYMRHYNEGARNSARTSTHIHINVDDMDELELVKFACLYLMYEKHIFRAYSPERESNHFCVPLGQCDGVIESLRNLYLNRSWKSFLAMQRDEAGGRYGAFNMMAIPKFGSIEFRHFIGSTKAEQLMGWSNVILLLKRFAKVNRTDMKDLLSDVSRTGYINFTYQTFEKKIADKFIKVPAFDQMMVDGVRLVQSILHPAEMKVPPDIERFVERREKELKSKKEAARKRISDEIEATRRSLQETGQEGGFAALEKAEAAAQAGQGDARNLVVDLEAGGEVGWGRFEVRPVEAEAVRPDPELEAAQRRLQEQEHERLMQMVRDAQARWARQGNNW